MPRMPRRSARSQAEAQRARDRATRAARNFERFAGDFENEVLAINFGDCSQCLKQVMRSELIRNQCNTCRKSTANLFCAENDMNIGEIPSELQNLSMIEQLLIARVHPVVSVYKIRGQQTAYSGHVVNFIQHVEHVSSRLPHQLGTLSAAVLLDRNTPSGLIQFRVRAMVVRRALIWLKANNQYYSDIVIDEECLDSLPVDGDVSDTLPTLSLEDQDLDTDPGTIDNLIHGSCFPSIPPVNEESIIRQNLDRLVSSHAHSTPNIGDWPDISQNPLNEFRSEGLICKAFPALFPYGRGDLFAPRLRSIPKHKYFKYLMQYKDERFSKDLRFPYYAYNSLARWEALNSGSVFIRMHDFEGVCAEDMQEMIDDPRRNLAASIMYYGCNLRGTRSFWKQRCSELIQMVRQLGTPSIFFTLSAADYHWPDLFRIIDSSINPDSLEERQRRQIMHDNPFKVSWFFNKRSDIFVKKFLTQWFPVKDFWYRFEWQHRGSPHIHGVLWLEDAPDCTDIDALDDAAKERIIEYFDQLVSASITEILPVLPQNNPCRKRYTQLTPAERVSDLDRILSSVQRHSRCGNYCLRRKKNSRVIQCRYGFPISLADESTLIKEAGSWRFVPKRNDELLQKFNRSVTQIWRGNTDFAAITSRDAVINYIAKYASKGEFPSVDYSDILRRVITRNPSTTPASSLIRQLLVSSVCDRNFSAQEVMHLLMGWPLYHASRTFVVLSLKNDWARLNNVAQSNAVDDYANRDMSLDDLSLFTYVKNYYRARGRTVKRRKECIVRIIPYLKLTNDPVEQAEYYKQQCQLNIPWRNNFESILPHDSSWYDLFLSHLDEIDDADSFADELPHPPDEFEYDTEDDVLDIVRDPNLAASRLHPTLQAPDPLGGRPIDEAFSWENLTDAGFSGSDLSDFLRSYQGVSTVDGPSAPVLQIDSMSSKQREVYSLCSSQLAEDYFLIKRVIVQGKAGTGKSALIRAMCQLMDDTHPDSRLYEVMAPTGVAAANIDGKTIHSLLRIPVQGQLLPLNGISLRQFQLEFREKKFIIIDEYSMIGLRMLNEIHTRLCEAKGSNDEVFGGFYIYFFGDLRQLPPVMDLAIYNEPRGDFSRLGLDYINSVQRGIVLDVVYRQNSQQVAFKNMLDAIATGKVSQDDWRLHMTRRSIIVSAANSNTFRDAIHLLCSSYGCVLWKTIGNPLLS